MSDYLSSVLDELVPTFEDEDGDWERVVAHAGGENPTTRAYPLPLDATSTSTEARERNGRWRERWLTRGRPAVIALALLTVLVVTPAFGLGERLLSLIQSKPNPADVQAPAWSPDGRTIVFVSWRDGNGEVYAMDANGSSPRNLTQNPAKDVRPAWSPDGRSIAFVSIRDRHQRMQQGVRTPPEPSDIYVMNADGSRKRNLTRDRASDDLPTWSPDGRRIAFLHGRGRGRGQLYVVNADGSGLRNLGRIAGPSLFASQLVWSPDGRTIHFGRYLVRTDGSGVRKLPYIPLTAVWSPDGRQVAFVGNKLRNRLPGQLGPCCKPNSDIYVMNADGSGTRRLTHNAGYDGEPAWSPDGRKIAFQSKRGFVVGQRMGIGEIYVMNADGSGKRNLTRNPAQDGRPSWSPDGRRIAFVSNRDGRRLEAHVMNADGSGQRSLTQGE